MITPILSPQKVPERAGMVYGPTVHGGTAFGNVTLIANQIYYYPVVIGKQISAVALLLLKATNVAGAARIGIYADNGGIPGALIVEAAAPFNLVTAGILSTAIAQTLAPGVYWIALLANVGAASFSFPYFYADTGMDTVNGTKICGYKQAFAYAALPANATPVLLADGQPGIGLGIGT